MRLKNLDLIVTVIIAVLNVVWALLPGRIPVIGIILALPLVFVLPGYILTEFMFRKRSLNASHRLLLSLGLSLALDVLSGLLLNLLPIGLQAISWAMSLGLLTAVLSLFVAYLRLRRSVSVNETRPPRFRFSISSFVLFGLAIVVAALSILYAVIGVVQQPHPGFTQLWMLPVVQAGKNCAVRLGVRSFESTPVTYRITMKMEQAQATIWPSIALAPEQDWDRLVSIPPGTTDNVSVEVQLYRVDKPQAAYREVNVTLHSCPTLHVTPIPYPVLATTYNGTIQDIPVNIATTMSLTRIRQSEGNITGYFTVGIGLRGNGSFRGIVTVTKHMHFTVIDDTGLAILSFDGSVQSAGTISGNYCSLDQEGQCSSRYGLWTVAPASS